MCLIYNSINYRRNVVGFEVVANIRMPLFCLTRSPVGALRVCYDLVRRKIRQHGGSLEMIQSTYIECFIIVDNQKCHMVHTIPRALCSGLMSDRK